MLTFHPDEVGKFFNIVHAHWAVPFYIHTGVDELFQGSEIDFQGLLGNLSDISRGFH